LRGFVRLGLDFAVLLQQDLYAAFRFLQFLAAGGGELHAFFKKVERALERDVALLKLTKDLLQPLEALFKFGQCKTLSQSYFISGPKVLDEILAPLA
jgi:hypothetical protein